MTFHGDTRVDHYFWLRDRNDPDTIAYLHAENRYTEACMKHTDALQEHLYQEMLGRIQQTDSSVPVKRDDYFYYTRMEEGKQYPIWCRKRGSLQEPEETLLDGNEMAAGQKYFRVGNFSPSPDHNLLAYSVDYEGDETYIIRVKDLATGRHLPDEIPNTYYTLEWANDNQTFFYTILDSALRPFKVLRHKLGHHEDAVAYHEPDERFTLAITRTLSQQFVLINVDSPVTSEVRYISADQPEAAFLPIVQRVQGVEYEVSHRGDSWFIRTNDSAKTFRVVQAPVGDAERHNWREIIAGRDEITIEDVAAFEDFLVTEQRHRGLMELHILDFRTGTSRAIEFPEPAYEAGIGDNAEFSTKLLRYHYQSLVTPPSVFDYHMETGERELRKQQKVLGGYDPSQYTTERIQATSHDGVAVPISIVYRKGLVKDGKAPMLLYGYGSYGISIDPSFRSDRFSLLDRGFAFAIAHIRGGMDLGKRWHEDGRMLSKKNTFLDFIAAAEKVIADRYTSSDQLAINGRSAGGLLMGAVTNMRPDLFGAVVAGVPFVDSLNTALDATLPLTIGEYEEFGNPADPQFYHYMKSYAPYENVEAKAYPAILITAGLNDPRVSYWEPAKWCAKLRELKTDHRPLLLKTNMGSGHFGASGRYEHLRETALEFAFLLDVFQVDLGAAPTAPPSGVIS